MLQKKYEDYLIELYNLFPEIKEESITSIIEHGLKRIYDLIKVGNDVKMNDRESSVYIGDHNNNPKKQWYFSKMKEHTKRRRIFLDQKIPWDKWHYFGLTEEENNIFVETGEFPTVQLYKILKECIIRRGIKYIYRIDLGYTIPENLVPWREEKKNIKLEECEISEQGKKILDFRAYKKALNLTYTKKNEENCTE